jgi:hypothetical protein
VPNKHRVHTPSGRARLEHGVRPKLFIAEYNAKFPPAIDFRIAYDETHTWKSDDYYGASLKSLADLLGRYGYTLVCCNTSGVNAFSSCTIPS